MPSHLSSKLALTPTPLLNSNKSVNPLITFLILIFLTLIEPEKLQAETISVADK